MQVTNVTIRLPAPGFRDRGFLAYASVEFDHCLVVHEMKVVQKDGRWFLFMPSRKITDHCPKCSSKNSVQSRFCSECGNELDPKRWTPLPDSPRTAPYLDVAHPISPSARRRIEEAVFDAYEKAAGEEKGPAPGGAA